MTHNFMRWCPIFVALVLPAVTSASAVDSARARAEMAFGTARLAVSVETSREKRRMLLERMLADLEYAGQGQPPTLCPETGQPGARLGRSSHWLAAWVALTGVVAASAGELPLSRRLLARATRIDPSVEGARPSRPGDGEDSRSVGEWLELAVQTAPGPRLVTLEVVLDRRMPVGDWPRVAEQPNLRLEPLEGAAPDIGPTPTARLRAALTDVGDFIDDCADGRPVTVAVDLPEGLYRLRVAGARAFGYVRVVPGARVGLRASREDNGRWGLTVSYLGPRLEDG